MLGKIWKKILLAILIVACLFDIVRKMVRKNSLQEELQATLDYFHAKNDAVQEQSVEQAPTEAVGTQGQTVQTEQTNGQAAQQQAVTPITQEEMEQIQQQYLQIQQQYEQQQQAQGTQTLQFTTNN